jgi:hypothetical protein
MACTLAESLNDPLHRKLRQLRCLRRRFDCCRVERTSSRAGVSPAEVQRLFTAHFIANCAATKHWMVICHNRRTSIPSCCIVLWAIQEPVTISYCIMLILRWYLWIVPHLLCGVVVVLAIKRRVHRRFPAFIALLSFSFVFELGVAMVITFLFPQPIYKWFVVVDVAATFCLQLFVFSEILRELLSSNESVTQILQHWPRRTAAALTLTAVFFAAFLPVTAREQVMNVFQTLNFGVNLVAIGLLLAMGVLTRVLGISWRSVPAGIVLGLALAAVGDIGSSALMAQLGRQAYIALDIARLVGFHVCTLVWLVYVLLPERAAQHLSGANVEVSDSQELQRLIERHR